MIELVREMLSYPFLVRALVSGTLVSLYASLLGVGLVPKRYSMIGGELSHASFGALSAALVIGRSPLKLSTPVVMLAVSFLPRVTENRKMKSDVTIIMISVSALVAGIVVTSMTTGMTTDVSSYMLGNILAMSLSGVRLSVALSVIVLRLFLSCYNKIFVVTFDEDFAKATGVRVPRYNILIVVPTAVTTMLGMRMMGVMLTSSLIIFPALTPIQVFKSFRDVVLPTGVVSMACFGISMAMSHRFSALAGASVVLANLAVFTLFALAQTVIRKLVWKG